METRETVVLQSVLHREGARMSRKNLGFFFRATVASESGRDSEENTVDRPGKIRGSRSLFAIVSDFPSVAKLQRETVRGKEKDREKYDPSAYLRKCLAKSVGTGNNYGSSIANQRRENTVQARVVCFSAEALGDSLDHLSSGIRAILTLPRAAARVYVVDVTNCFRSSIVHNENRFLGNRSDRGGGVETSIGSVNEYVETANDDGKREETKRDYSSNDTTETVDANTFENSGRDGLGVENINVDGIPKCIDGLVKIKIPKRLVNVVIGMNACIARNICSKTGVIKLIVNNVFNDFEDSFVFVEGSNDQIEQVFKLLQVCLKHC